MSTGPRNPFIEEDDADASTVLMAGSQRARFLADLDAHPTPDARSEGHLLLEAPLLPEGSLESAPRELEESPVRWFAPVLLAAVVLGFAAAGILWAL